MPRRLLAASLALLCALPPDAAAAQALAALREALQGGAAFDGARLRRQDAVVVPASTSRREGLLRSVPEAAPKPPASEPETAKGVSAGFLGLYPESDFVLGTGRCEACRGPVEGKWYFPDELIATPKTGTPALVWLGAREVLEGAVLSEDGRFLRLQDGTTLPLELAPRIPSNRSYFDASSLAYLRGRPLRVRGDFVERSGVRTFRARSFWLEDFRVEPSRLEAADAQGVAGIDALVAADQGGAQAPFQAKLLWERPGQGRAWAGLSVMGLMLNGAQGDDDESLGGHFGFFTGLFPAGGSLADWTVSNFYDMDSVSEKGIVAALVPMDKYLSDLNSGQSWYRPTGMLVAVMKDARVPLQLQEKFKERYAKYYAHEIRYHRTFSPCTAQVVDPLRQEGWNYPEQGRTPDLVARAVAGLVSAGSGDQEAGQGIYDSLRQEPTHLFPRAAFNSLGADLMSLAGAGGADLLGRTLTPFEKSVSEDVVALLWVRVPQIPSSRKFGRDPAGGVADYFTRVPLDRSQWQTVPTQPRPYPPPH
ncbi:MAG TPA: hypothetical protein DCM05_17075 [Elusimicrobia bacterium]|nr:hypothetical protein [Elusimicrobiota bacterium]